MDPLVLDEAAPPLGGIWGGIFVDYQFKVFLQEFLGRAMLERLTRKYPSVVDSLEKEFRSLKTIVGMDGIKKKYRVSFSGVLRNSIREELGLPTLKDLVEAYNLNKGKVEFDLTDARMRSKITRDSVLTFSEDQMLEFFEPTMQKICDCIREALRKAPGISSVVLVGGYGSSRVLGHRIRETFKNDASGITVMIPDGTVRPQAAIVHGAAYHGLYSSVIGTRVAKKTYGIGTNLKWYTGCRFPESTAAWDSTLQEMRVDNVCSTLVQKDAMISPGETFKSLGFRCLHPNQRSVKFESFPVRLLFAYFHNR